jgi:succinoglycan biosynthesis protein ExoV
VCRRLGFGYIDPREPRQTVIDGIRRTHVLIAEAMHGAIVADALGVPWIAVRSGGAGTLEFKWRDWCSSLGLDYQPHSVVPIFATSRSKARLMVKMGMAAAQLSWLSRTARPQLSDAAVRQERLTQLHERLDSLRRNLDREQAHVALVHS